MSTEKTSQTGRTPVDQVVREAIAAYAAGDWDAALAAISDDMRIHLAGAPPMQGKDAWRSGAETLHTGFSDIAFEISNVLVDGDRVALCNRMTARHTDDFAGVPASGREVTMESIEIYRVRDGLVVEEWISSDLAGLFGQLQAD